MPPSRSPISRELRSIRTSFRQLARSFTRLGPLLVSTAAASRNSKPAAEQPGSTRRKPRLTAKDRARLKLQGRYMGTLRGLKLRDRARVKKVRAENGIRAAIAAARRLAG
jgi:hypothetical protein